MSDRVEGLRQAAETRVQTLITKGQATGDRAKDLVAASQEAVTQFQRRVDERVRTAVEGMSSLPEIKRELQQIATRLDEIDARLKDLERYKEKPVIVACATGNRSGSAQDSANRWAPRVPSSSS